MTVWQTADIYFPVFAVNYSFSLFCGLLLTRITFIVKDVLFCLIKSAWSIKLYCNRDVVSP